MRSGDKLICTRGNILYKEGEIYTVGDFINDRYFQLLVDDHHEYWYATMDDKGIHVSFSTIDASYHDAYFIKLHHPYDQPNGIKPRRQL